MTDNYFCIVGAQRSGTTYLYQMLDSHPEIEMAKPFKPEPKYFLNEMKFASGKKHYLNKYFNNLPESITAIGEKGTSYLEFPIIAERIRTYFPDGKILIILRNPVKRAISNYFFTVKNGLETRTLNEVFIAKKEPPKIDMKISVSPFDYLKRGNYEIYLPPYLNLFKQNLKIVIFEELIGNFEKLNEVYAFIGVKTPFMPENISEQVNSSVISTDNIVSDEIIKELKNYYKESIKKTELLLNRTIPFWND